MFKRYLALTVSVILLNVCVIAYAADGFDGGNTNADNSITDVVKWLDSSVHNIGEKYVTDVSVNTSVGAFIGNFKNHENGVMVEDAETSDIVKTGMKVKHIISGKELIIAVAGDIDGNGQATVTDISLIQNHINGGSKLAVDSVKFTAADIDANGRVTVVDLVNVKKYIMGE